MKAFKFLTLYVQHRRVVNFSKRIRPQVQYAILSGNAQSIRLSWD